MGRAGRNERLESLVLLFAEKVILAAVVPSLVLLAANPMKFDSHQQFSAAIAVLAIGYFVAHTLQNNTGAKTSTAIPVQSSGDTPGGERIFLPQDVDAEYLTGLLSETTILQGDAILRSLSWKVDEGFWFRMAGSGEC
jgi:hypothetical protein